MRQFFSEIPEAIDNTVKIAQMCHTEYDFDTNTLSLDNGDTVKYKYLIGADGALSPTRRALGYKQPDYIFCTETFVPKTDAFNDDSIRIYFGYLNNEYCKRCNNWSGYGITSDPKRQPNSEALNMLRHSFPTMEECEMQIHEMMQRERAKKHAQMMEFYAKLTADKVLPLSRENYLYYFGEVTGQTNALTGSGLHPTLLGVRRDYECYDISFRKHAGEKWAVHYDPQDMSTVLATNADGTLRYTLEEKYVQPMALADRKEGDAQQLERINGFNKQLEAHVIHQLGVYGEDFQRVAARNPQLDTLRRFCLLDSRGQHKLPKAQARLTAQDIEAVEVQTVDVPLLPQGAAPADRDDYSIF